MKRKGRRKRFLEGRRRFLIGLSLVLAFAGSALALLFSGSLEEAQEGLDQWPEETGEQRGVVAEKEAPVLDPLTLRDRLEEVAQGHEGIHGYSVATAATELYLLPPNPIRGVTMSSVAQPDASCDPMGEFCPSP